LQRSLKKHDDDPGGATGKLDGHFEHTESPTAEYVFSAHASQAEEELLPTLGLKVPAEHGEHARDEVLPILGLYLPEGQKLQSDSDILPLLELKYVNNTNN